MNSYYQLLVVLSFATFLMACGNRETKTNQTSETQVEVEMKTTYYENGNKEEEFQVKKGTEKKHGSYKLYDENGVMLSERTYADGVENGIARDYHETGNIQREVNVVDGKYEGEMKTYYPDGKTLLQKGMFENDLLEGKLINYYEDGTLKSEVTMVAGLTNGEFKEYHPNAKVSAEGTFISVGEEDEKEDGELKEYNSQGELMAKKICSKGICCTVWTKAKGNVKPSSPYCVAIITGKGQQ